MKKESLKRIIFAMLVIAFTFGMSFSTEAASSKTQVKKTIVQFYKASRAFNTSKMNKYVLKSSDKKELSEDSGMYKTIGKKYNKKNTWKISGIKVKGKTATAKVKVKYKSLYNPFQSALTDSVAYYTKNPNISDSDLEKYLIEAMKKHVKSEGYKWKTKTVKVALVKRNGTWKIKKITDSIADTIENDCVSAIKDLDM